jgi:Peptidase family M28
MSTMRRRVSHGLVTGVALAGLVTFLAPPGHAAAPQAAAAAGPAASAPGAFDSARAWAHVRQMVAIGPRPAGSPQLRETRAYITRQLAAMGLTVREQPFVADTPLGRVSMINLVVRVPGRRTDRILVTGHYDTKLMRGRPFVGASDGASSAAFLIELARVLKARPRDFTYELVWFDGEEAFCTGWDECGRPDSPDNTYGSRLYVQAARKANALDTIKAMILVDMIGADGLVLRRDAKSTPWLTEAIWSTARRMAYDHVFVDASLPVEDDHVAFLDAGIPSVDLIDLEDYPYWHTPEDSLDHVSARSLQIVGDVLLASLPDIEAKLKASAR